MPLAAWMRFIVRQAKAGVAIVDPDAARLAADRRACTGDARADVARFAVCEAVLPPALLADERFRRALEAAYARLGDAACGHSHRSCPHEHFAPNFHRRRRHRRRRHHMPEHPPP